MTSGGMDDSKTETQRAFPLERPCIVLEDRNLPSAIRMVQNPHYRVSRASVGREFVLENIVAITVDRLLSLLL